MKTADVAGDLSIGVLAKRTGCTVPTIRYCEEIGLIPAAKRRPSGHRVYSSQAQQQLTFFRQCRDFGFPIEQVRELVALSQSPERECSETLAIAQHHLQAIRAKLLELQQLEHSLARVAQACAGGSAVDCSILRDMALTAIGKGCCGPRPAP